VLGHIGKNGVYCDLVKNVKEAFEVCELVRIDCQGMKGSDFRKIGAKLKVYSNYYSLEICYFKSCVQPLVEPVGWVMNRFAGSCSMCARIF